MRILVTGAKGFIGKNLLVFLKERQDFRVTTYDNGDGDEKFEKEVLAADFIVHLAGVNRPKNVDEFKSGNTDLTKRIVDLLNERQRRTPLIFASSIQAELDNDYGKSKKAAEDYILAKYQDGIVFRLHNVFGKYCRPNYNSVVATFCYNIAHNKRIEIDDPSAEISLIYIDDVCRTFIDVIDKKTQLQKPYNYIAPVKKITVGELANLLKSFDQDLHSLMVPETGDAFIKKLFSTYISYCELTDMVMDAKMHSDQRGSFTELIHTKRCGQFSVSTSKPGVVRGNHYHHTKIEKFIVVKGAAEIALRKIDEEEIWKIPVSGDNVQVVTIPVGYTHSIRNVGDTEMVLLIWCNEVFDPENPDTYFLEV